MWTLDTDTPVLLRRILQTLLFQEKGVKLYIDDRIGLRHKRDVKIQSRPPKPYNREVNFNIVWLYGEISTPHIPPHCLNRLANTENGGRRRGEACCRYNTERESATYPQPPNPFNTTILWKIYATGQWGGGGGMKQTAVYRYWAWCDVPPLLLLPEQQRHPPHVWNLHTHTILPFHLFERLGAEKLRTFIRL